MIKARVYAALCVLSSLALAHSADAQTTITVFLEDLQMVDARARLAGQASTSREQVVLVPQPDAGWIDQAQGWEPEPGVTVPPDYSIKWLTLSATDLEPGDREALRGLFAHCTKVGLLLQTNPAKYLLVVHVELASPADASLEVLPTGPPILEVELKAGSEVLCQLRRNP